MQTIDSGIGKRYYFTCPYCRSRTSRLYLKQTIACRECHDLSYHSQNVSNEDRWLLRRSRLLERNGLSFEQAMYRERKKGMHKKTFEKLMNEFHLLTDMGIDIHLNRFEYKNVLRLIREGRRTGDYCQVRSVNAVDKMIIFFDCIGDV